MKWCEAEPCGQKTYDGLPLCSYHTKQEKGLTQPADQILTPTEIENMFRGRTRHDGRRLDAYTR